VLLKYAFNTSAAQTVTFESESLFAKIDDKAFLESLIENLRLPHTLVTISDYFMKFVHPLKRLVFDP
jgi:hypothetical protein